MAKHKLPANYDIYLNLYDELEEANYRKKLESFYYEYYFAEEKMNIIDVLDLLNAQILLIPMLKSKHSVLGSMEGTDARISRRQRRLPQMGNTGTDYNVIGNEIHSLKEEKCQLQ